MIAKLPLQRPNKYETYLKRMIQKIKQLCIFSADYPDTCLMQNGILQQTCSCRNMLQEVLGCVVVVIGYNINVLQQTACLVVNPITVGNFAFLFNCTLVGRTSDSMMIPT